MKFSKLKTDSFAGARSRLGLSQSQLAAHLGISKAAIGMAEIGRRKLPAAALFKLAQLEIKMAGALAPGKVAIAEEAIIDIPTEARCATLRLREIQCERKIEKMTETLEEMIDQHKRHHMQLRLLEEMLDKEADEPGNAIVLFMHLRRDYLLKQLAKCSMTEQTLLRNKIAILGAETHLNKSVRQQMK